MWVIENWDKKFLKISEPMVADQLTINPIKERQIDRN